MITIIISIIIVIIIIIIAVSDNQTARGPSGNKLISVVTNHTTATHVINTVILTM